MPEPPASELLATWRRLSRWPGGRWLFAVMLGRRARYTGSISPRVEELRPGYARVAMRDRPAVRNHLRSVHAIALMNLAEVTSGLAMMSGLPADGRAIITALSIEYRKKARGRLVAESTVEPPDTSERREVLLDAIVRDAAGDVVASATATWLVGPKR